MQKNKKKPKKNIYFMVNFFDISELVKSNTMPVPVEQKISFEI
jgi:hypothetical protein